MGYTIHHPSSGPPQLYPVVHHYGVGWGGGGGSAGGGRGSCVRAIMRKEDVGKVSLALLLLLSSLGSEKEEMLHCTAPN